jgi:rhodanese-related sulfurtransferase
MKHHLNYPIDLGVDARAYVDTFMRCIEWMGELSKADPVVVYCAHGVHVGCRTTAKLREAGFDARYMTSGHSSWKAIGGEMELQP